MSLSFDYGDYRIVSRLNEAQSGRLVEAVVAGDVDRETVFRDNWRTLSARVRFEDQSLLLKVPRARNGRRWERFLTRFRGSDAVRTFRHLERMAAMGFSAPEPVLAWEQRQGGAVVDSFVCYRFVDGCPARPEDAPKVIAALQALHQKGYLRSDAQMANFIVNGEHITFIDFRLKKPRFLPALQKARELDRFLRNCPEARRSLDPSLASSGWLRLATRLEDARFALRNLKRRFRKR